MIKKTLALVALSLMAAGSVFAQANKLYLYIWSEYIDPAIITQFEEKFDCKVTIDLYEDNESMMAKLKGGGDSLYDVCVPSDYIIPALIGEKLIQPIRKENVPNLANVEDKFINPPYDPGNVYSAPYQWGTVGLYIRPAEGQTVDETWGLIYDPAKQPGPFFIIDSMREAIGGALKLKGYSLNSTDPTQLKEARDMLIEAKKRCAGFEGGVGGKNKVLAKAAVLAVVYNGDAVRGMGEDAETRYFVPREGGEIWMDNMCVPAKAPNRDMAEKFINYILDPEVGAQLSNFNQYATPNKASLAHITPDDLKNTAIYPTEEIKAKLEFLQDLGEATRIYDEIWTQVKSK